MRRGSRLWFASEMMALLQDPEVDRVPDPRAIGSYLAYQFVPHPMSAFIGIEKLPPASTLVVDASGSEQRRYWRIDYAVPEPRASVAELEERLRELIWESTRIRLISEVPLGAFLSGGIDSSAVVAAMADQMPEPSRRSRLVFPTRTLTRFAMPGWSRSASRPTIANSSSSHRHSRSCPSSPGTTANRSRIPLRFRASTLPS